MRGTREFVYPNTGIHILVSRQAQRRIRQERLEAFLKTLKDVLESLGATGAYVSKGGPGLEITVHGLPFKVKPWKLKA